MSGEEPEAVANGLVGRPSGVSVLTTHALYEVRFEDGEIGVVWRTAYDRGSARKPDQLSWGSGTTPTFFGPDGARGAIVDNADQFPNLLVLSAETGNGLSHDERDVRRGELVLAGAGGKGAQFTLGFR